MKDIEELENMTLWDITVNEGALTQLVLGVLLLILSVMYLFINLYCKLKFGLRG